MTSEQNYLKYLELSLANQGQMMMVRHMSDADACDILGQGSKFLDLFAFESGAGNFKDFENCIHAQDIERYRSAVDGCDGLDSKSYDVSYLLCGVDGKYSAVIEKGVVSIENGQRVIHATIGHEKKIEKSIDIAGDRLLYRGRQEFVQEVDYVLDQMNPAIQTGFVLVLGIDRLSMINEAFGALVVDELLEMFGPKLQRVVGESGDVYHISGDSYGIVFPQSAGSEMPAMARHVLNHFYENLVQVGEACLRVSISVGGRILDINVGSGSNVIAHAQRALQVAKERGRGCFVAYNHDEHTTDSSQSVLRIGDEFLRGLKDGRVRLAFQPIVAADGGEVSFHECLMRLTDLDGRVHAAGTFIPAVEQLGLARIVDQFCIRQALQELLLFPELTLSVNVTNWTLMDNDWLRGLVYILSDREDVARRLIVEITESVAMVDIRQTLRVVRTLRDLGCRVALDDFGAGATAFSQLRELDLDIVKIDKSFVRHMSDGQNYLFIKTLQSLADGMNLETVGEGAETLDEADILAKDGVTYIQGYAYGFPSMERSWLPKDHVYRHKALEDISKEDEFFLSE